MKALSLTQPWASLVAIGAKRIETRSWGTPYRGWLAIHASKAFPMEARQLFRTEPFRECLQQAGLLGVPKRDGAGPNDPYDYSRAEFHWYRWKGERTGTWHSLPLGAIVAVAELTDVISTDKASLFCEIESHGAKHELDFGNYTPGRYAWLLSNVRPLPEPIPCKGALGLWTPPPDVLAKLEAFAHA